MVTKELYDTRPKFNDIFFDADWKSISAYNQTYCNIGWVILYRSRRRHGCMSGMKILKKLFELTGREKTMTLEQDLKALQKEIKALEKKMDKLAMSIQKNQKPKAAKSSKAKTAKKAPAKKTPQKGGPLKMTAADRVIEIISQSEKGIDAAALVQKTGFNAKKIQNILYRVHKQGKIKRAGKGIYVGA
jgi:predicted Rossmann fold nucleotide-binding protein DprA/Smf involved in DNA uptake